MYAPHFQLRSFDVVNDRAKFAVMRHLLEALTTANMAYLLAVPSTPLLYQAGILYVNEPDGRDDWQDIPETIKRREGDCEDLACWRVAELRRAGEVGTRHRITVSELKDSRGNPVTTYHITVIRSRLAPPLPHQAPIVRPGEQIEDPSRILGMK